MRAAGVGVAAAALLWWWGTGALAGTAQSARSATALDADRALEVSQAAIGRSLGEYRLRDRRGREVTLREVAGGRPLVVSLIYTSCQHVCTVLTRSLARVVEVAREALGEDSFAVATIGFDTARDTPERMASYARAQGVAGQPGWWFLSGDAETVGRLVEALGFTYFPSPKGFDHLAQTTVVDADARVYAQVYGGSPEPPALVEPLKDLVLGGGRAALPTSVKGWVDKLRFFCTVYDPASGRYRFDYSIYIGIAAGLSVFTGLIIFLVRAWRESGPRSA